MFSTKTHLILLFLMVSVILSSSCGTRDQDLNVLIVTIDTLRADHLGCYGYERNTSPNIDRLAQEGVLFENAYSPMPTTLPSHVSIMTSQYPRSSGVMRNYDILPQEADTLAEILKRNGYVTAGFVSTFALERRLGLNQGFDTYRDIIDDAGEQKAEQTFGAARKWLLDNHKKSFFLWVHFYDPHTFYSAPPPFNNKFSTYSVDIPQEYGFVKDPKKYNSRILEGTIAAYDDEIAYADHYVGQLLKLLEELQIKSRTLVILTSDHGESLSELLDPYGYVFDHGEFLYAHQLKIPLIFRFPKPITGFIPGTTRSGLYDLTDLMPTILDLLDIRSPTEMSGKSILKGEGKSYLFAQRRDFREPARDFLKGKQYSVITNRWHLITPGIIGRELYDLANDPLQRVNIVEERPELSKKMEDQLSIWVKTVEETAKGPSPLDQEARERLRSLGYLE